MPLALLDEMIAERYIRRYEHDNGDLVGFTYTERAQWDNEWNEATSNCRGLIVNTNWDVIARPFPKFFNLGYDQAEDKRRASMPFNLFEKVDGSLGIHYIWGSEHWIATKGAFHSEQAQWATEFFRGHTMGHDTTRPNTTGLYEIIYPENRIVVDYGTRSDMVFLAALDNTTARRVHVSAWANSAGSYLPGLAALNEVRTTYAHLDDGNFEGFVAEWEDGHRVKIKLDEYVRLHRIMSSTSNRTIWEALSAGTTLEAMLESTPDEFQQWVIATAKDLGSLFENFVLDMAAEFGNIYFVGIDRKTFAERAKATPWPGVMFSLLDGKPIDSHVWRLLRPDVIEYPPVGPGADQSAAA